jgi:hypothetical protein
LRLGLGLGHRGRAEKRAQDARAGDSAPVGVSAAIVAGCGAADTLGLPLGQVRVLHGSTPFLDEGYGAFASRSTVLGGSAVFEAANALLAKIRAAAGARLGCAAEQIELADGCARAPTGSCGADEQREDTSALHSISSSARARIAGGIVRPSAFAVASGARHSHCSGSRAGRSRRPGEQARTAAQTALSLGHRCPSRRALGRRKCRADARAHAMSPDILAVIGR